MAKKKADAKKAKESPAWQKGLDAARALPIHVPVYIHCDNSYPIGRTDWAYVTSKGDVYLNPRMNGTPKEWEYVIAHCMLHLGFGHIRRGADSFWNTACDWVVTKFLKDSHIGTPPMEFQQEFPFPVKNEDQVYQQLQDRPNKAMPLFSLTNGRPDMVWDGESKEDYTEALAWSLQSSIQKALEKANYSENYPSNRISLTKYGRAKEWFISSYPLLGAIAASFRIIDDNDVAWRMHVPIAAVSPALQEIYINPKARLTLEEWKFILAHEFLHAALRHDLRCEDRNPELWNIVCDYVINDWLIDMKVGTMPEGLLYDPAFHGQSAESLYELLAVNIRHYINGDPGDLIYDGARVGSWSPEELDRFYRSAMQQGLEYHQNQNRGYLPAALIEEIYAMSRPSIRWDVELAKWFDENFITTEKYRSYSRMSRRQSSTPDIPRPAWRQAEEQEAQHMFGVLLDTSGSMDRHLLAAALGTIASYSEARDVKRIRLVFCDAAPYDQGYIPPEDLAEAVQIHGRGGTVLQPGIDLLDRDPRFPKDAPLLIITDGKCDRLNLKGRNHAYLVPWGNRMPFPPKGPVFRLK